MEIYTDDVGTNELRFGSDMEHSVTWSGRNPEDIVFFITARDVSTSVALSIDGIRASLVKDSASIRFSNPKQLMEQATLPLDVANVVCSALDIMCES
ncbi:hypothetical protein [Vibrio coralliilyticus]|uniref:hypothetical protein n=1 Tax=Vibrio coralliilyticus TaxID=190893 RepID=UPI001E5B78D0|nr:hypothetical protein [Vibrio coralliilyticus]MCC2525013.1 hypothetical protein [Vibrio coralliilyticus]